ncbi:MAG: hypothetical protein WBH77_08380 [Saccharofermentanales bacterium]
MKQTSLAASAALRRIICFTLILILLCSVSCKKDDKAEFSKRTQTASSARTNKSWNKVVFTQSEQASESTSGTPEMSQTNGQTSETVNEGTSTSTGQTTDESAVETTNETTGQTTSATTAVPTTGSTTAATTQPAPTIAPTTAATTQPAPTTAPTTAATTQPAPTTAPTTAATTGSQGGLTPDQITGNWEAYLTVNFYSEINEPGVLDNIWSEEFVFAMTLTHISGNRYTVSLTPTKYSIDYEEASMEGIRQGPLNYEAELNNGKLSFSVESEAFGFEGFEEKGFIKPLDLDILLNTEQYLSGIIYISKDTTINGLPSVVNVSFYIMKV